MWPQKPLTANPDESDQSISDDEELGHDWPGNCVSLAASAEKKGASEILSRLELLEGTHQIETKTSSLSRMKQTSSVLEDDVEMPDFYDEGDFICPPKRVIVEREGNNVLSKISSPDEAKKFSKDAVLGDRAEKQENLYSWSSANKEAKTLMHLSKHTSCHSKTKNSSKGVKGKGKPKFTFRFQSYREGLSSPSTSKDENNLAINKVPEGLDATELRTELPEDIQEEEKDLPETMSREVEALRNECREQSMAVLLDGLQDTISFPRQNSRKSRRKRGKRLQISVKRNISPLGDRTANGEVFPDLMDGSKSSSDNENPDKDVELDIPEMRRQTIVDQFQEAFGATFSNNDRMSLRTAHKAQRSGLFWRLQQVMQTGKEQETEFLQKLKNGVYQISDESSCINVKVLSRHLEGKLTVCHCFVSESFESLPWSEPLKELENEGAAKTIIFNQRVPIVVDLEVGNCVCIHPPWKEVQVSNDKSIILATYFSNFQPRNLGLPLKV